MPEIKVQCPQCQVTVRLASLPVGKPAITCPKCKARVPLTEAPPPAPPPPPRPKRRDRDWSDLAPDRRGPLFGSELWAASALVGVCILLAIICFFGKWAAIGGLVGMFIVISILSFWGGIWLLVIAFHEDVVQGILCLFVPFYSLYYVISRWSDCYRAFTVQMSSLLVIPMIAIGAVGLGMSAKGEIEDRYAENERGASGRSGRNNPVNFPNFPASPPVNLPKTSGKAHNDPKYLDYALEDLRSNDANHRTDGARNLGEFRPNNRKAEIVKALEEACGDPTPRVRAEALKALANWSGKDSMAKFLTGLKDKDHGVAHAALDFVGRSKDERALEPLIESLPTLHDDAARVIRGYGPAAEKALIQAVSKGTQEVRREAIDVLKDMGTAEAVTVVLEALNDSDHEIRRRAILFFKRHKDPRAAEGLAEAMAHHRNEAVDALRQLGAAAEKPVLKVVMREDFGARREALQLLKDIGTKESVPELRTLLLKRGRENDAARDALRAIAGRHPKDFPADKPPIWEVDRVTQALADIQSTDVFKRGDALEQLVRLEPDERKEEVIKVVEGLFTDRDNRVRAKAIEIYAVWSGKDAVVKLIGFLSEDDGGVRQAAMKGLAKLKDERGIAPLAARLPNFFDRTHAAAALKEFGVKAQVEVSKYCDHRDGSARQEATKLLGAIGDKEAIPALQKLINQRKDAALSTVAIQAMAELKARLAAEEKKDNEKK